MSYFGIRAIIPQPAENIRAVGDVFISLGLLVLEKTNWLNWSVYIIIAVLVIIICLQRRNLKKCNERIGDLTKQVEKDDAYRSSSNLTKSGETPKEGGKV
jgi:ABC-type amino acid transport system permease subunit